MPQVESATASEAPPPQDAWLVELGSRLPQWESLRDSSKVIIPISISRVNQFDAARLDVEMSAMLKEQLVKVFSLMKPGLLFQYEPELDAFLEFLIWRFSIWADKPTPGNALMNLRYRDERAAPITGKEVRTGLEGPGLSVSQKIFYCISFVGGQYVWSRLQSFSAFRRWGDSEQRPLARRAWALMRNAEVFYRAASFFNLLLFLYGGRYKTVVERILKARLVYGSPNMNRAVSFEYMNRQLVWNEFSEMLLLLLPLLNSSSVKKFLLPFSKDKSGGSSGDEADCPICRSSPSIPFIALPCQHRYCYYCLRTRCSATTSYRCTRCDGAVVAIQRLGSG
ncbi:peroxisome assembly factor 1 isoform X1 [Zea mays]|uniref:RING-type E3 ubiquitin transferase (cysteine targeting) n=3 Tax=Zea mays TaxID=4577 RepID=B4FCL8_MAIZE|nr:peroxisome assembly factor 1 [Zea mays]XP_035816934.1 peroxisome assembly factor 1 isoform X1 [Zea mays]ACF79861.1 unknown [Zea mays]ACG36831.1 peroxisome assembly factor 1 [Zea mays]ONM02011.1 Peroxisome biogenesis protein 2 [Zea mays]ONM02015.1 Peroxisome biogenesis protein 2 [Zea mays]|eukprot:NP_001131851.1 peroxisome assembly factor 1 [Zea mays]